MSIHALILLPRPEIPFISQSPFAEVAMDVPLQQLFQDLPYDDLWADAGLSNCVRYVRGSKNLVIPDSWRPVLPTEL